MRRFIFFALATVAVLAIAGAVSGGPDTSALAQGTTGQDRLTVFETFGREA